MTTEPFYEPHILEMSLEKYADIAIDGGLWLVGELLAQGCLTEHGFVPDSRYVYKARHRETAIIELSRASEEFRHQVFIAGFLMLPDNGAQGTFKRLLVTHTEMLHETFRREWELRTRRMINVSHRHWLQANVTAQILHKLILDR
ncbi:hypothetical protein AFIC_000451 [[Pseudomonas] carboxydohydrogena]|jgi:hypothetical protein|uniref:Uncharacterized protein n=1 Tax=Afipia carboxydohydrogena TaxID=290 RepID=A0ABY8BQN5_AFICR|nr:hypothetical protein [[Pseudomonas] carboxydohydrogena]WEF51994.1 hypothetical protein AFIC_000451 [[Pseudomonas] carboxydohydrogena]